ncbi:MAG: GNAT family N-acetyltransferase [Caldilineaceae bacterium]|nr:GNAT family N-acetyltransferase [Caldilineaceae bacterium]
MSNATSETPIPSQQLRMVWPKSKLDQPPSVQVPAGYQLRTYRPGDEPSFFHIMSLAGFERWDMAALLPWFQKILPAGWFVVENLANQQLVATAMAVHNPSAYYPFGGELGWVAAHPDHKGQGLGYAVCGAVTGRLLRGGYTSIYLNTDDHRLPAIRTYLKLGYRPLILTGDMSGRWEKLCQKLGWPFTPEEWSVL